MFLVTINRTTFYPKKCSSLDNKSYGNRICNSLLDFYLGSMRIVEFGSYTQNGINVKYMKYVVYGTF